MAEDQAEAGASVSSDDFINSMDFTIEENLLMPVFKKTHISTRAIENYLATGEIINYSEANNKKNALRQAASLFRLVKGELFRHGSDREYKKYGLRIVVHDDEPQKKLDVLAKCHVDEEGNHLGMNNTIKRVSEIYYWQGVSAHVKLFLKKCGLCKIRSKMDSDTWLVEEKKMLSKKKERHTVCNEAKKELKNLGRIKKATPPETFFIVNAERKVELDKLTEESEMLIDSNNIEYVVETLGYSDESCEMHEVCHVFNVPDIVPIPNRYRSREIETFLKKGTYPDDFTSNQKSGLRGPAAQYTILDDELYHEGNKKGSRGLRMVIHDDQPALKVKIMVENHLDEDGTHLGLNRTMTRASEKYFWVGLSTDVRKFLLNCKVCMLTRGKKLMGDGEMYADEVQKLKNKHHEKHGETSNAEQVCETFEEITEEVEQQGTDKSADGYGHQIIRLVGPNEDVTEITVAVVNGDFAAEGMTEEQYAALTAASNVETVTQTPENSESIIPSQIAQTEEIVEQNQGNEAADTQQSVEQVIPDSNDQIVHIELAENSEGTDTGTGENRIEEASAEETSAVEAAIGMLINKTKENVSAAFVEGKEKLDTENDCNTVEISIHPVATNEGVLASDKAPPEEIREGCRQPETTNPVSKTGQISFYEDIIYVSRSHRTKAMQLYLEATALSPGFTRTQLIEMTKTFFVEDGVLYRRPSRYKGRQIVICDRNPELKLKIIKESHTKANGRHFSEVLTLQAVQYKYYWDEVKWDVHRFYMRCSKCVRKGEDVRLRRKVLTVEEQKQQEKQARKRCNTIGLSAKRNREFRIRHRDKLEKFRLWNKYGKDKGEYYAEMEEAMDEIVEEEEAVAENLDGTALVKPDIPSEDESDIEINMPGSDDEPDQTSGNAKSSQEVKVPQLYRMVLYATLEQEDAMRELFLEEDWNYKLEGMKKFVDVAEEGKTFDARRNTVYEMTMIVRLNQEEALRKMFMLQGWQYSLEELEPVKPGSVKTSSSTPAASSVKKVVKKVASTPLVKEEPKSPPKERRSTRQKPEVNSTPLRKTILVDPEWEEETSSKGRKRSLDVDTAVEGRRSSRREVKRPRRYSPDAEEEPVKVKLENEFTPKQRGKQQTSKSDGGSEVAGTPKRQTSNRLRTDSKKEKDGTFTNTRPTARSKEVDTEADNDQDVAEVDKQSSLVKSVFSSKKTLVPEVEVRTKEGDSDEDCYEEMEQDSSDMFEDDDEGGNDMEDDFDDDDEDEEEGDKNLDIFEDTDWPSDKDEVENFVKKGLVKVCQMCDRVFKKSQQTEYEDHISQHDGANTYPCNSCSKLFLDSQCLQVHERVHVEGKQEVCGACSLEFHTSFQQAAHMYKVHGKSSMFSCDICKAKFVNIKFLRTEMLFDGELSFFRCVMCQR